MCRLYGFRASEPTKVECTLVYAQNALMAQSREDLSGHAHAHGWGVATYEDHSVHVERQAWAAYHGEHFRRAAARIFSRQVLAHIRRATVGAPKIENTHPFIDGRWAFIHNGTIPNFQRLRPRLLAMLPEQRRKAIQGDTDSEHVFHYLRDLQAHAPDRALFDVVRRGLRQIVEWCRELDLAAKVGLNVILTDGDRWSEAALGAPFITSSAMVCTTARFVGSRIFIMISIGLTAPSLSHPSRSATRNGANCPSTQFIG